jgi:hypothetical protein
VVASRKQGMLFSLNQHILMQPQVGILPPQEDGAAAGERESQLMVWLGHAARKGHDQVCLQQGYGGWG